MNEKLLVPDNKALIDVYIEFHGFEMLLVFIYKHYFSTSGCLDPFIRKNLDKDRKENSGMRNLYSNSAPL